MAGPKIIRQVVNREFIDYVVDMIDKNENLFVQNRASPHRKYWFVPFDSKIQVIKNHLISAFEISNAINDPILPDFIGFITDGGSVHPHRDNRFMERHGIRLNVMLRKPSSGGEPILDGQSFTVEEGDCWLNPSTIRIHSCTPVHGDRPRNIISFGLQVPQSEIDRYL